MTAPHPDATGRPMLTTRAHRGDAIGEVLDDVVDLQPEVSRAQLSYGIAEEPAIFLDDACFVRGPERHGE